MTYDENKVIINFTTVVESRTIGVDIDRICSFCGIW